MKTNAKLIMILKTVYAPNHQTACQDLPTPTIVTMLKLGDVRLAVAQEFALDSTVLVRLQDWSQDQNARIPPLLPSYQVIGLI